MAQFPEEGVRVGKEVSVVIHGAEEIREQALTRLDGSL